MYCKYRGYGRRQNYVNRTPPPPFIFLYILQMQDLARLLVNQHILVNLKGLAAIAQEIPKDRSRSDDFQLPAGRRFPFWELIAKLFSESAGDVNTLVYKLSMKIVLSLKII